MIFIPTKQCNNGAVNSGSGTIQVKNIDNIPNFGANLQWEMACNKSGYWKASITPDAKDLPSFTVLDKQFGLSSVLVTIRCAAHSCICVV